MNPERGILYHNINRPLYMQLKDLLTEKIESGELEPGDAIPGERTLAEMYEVSRVTVRKCIGAMVEEGYLLRSHGKDTIVANRKINHRLGLLVGIAEELSDISQDIRIRGIHQGFRKAPASVSQALQISEESRIYEFDRVVYADGRPLALNYSYVPQEVGKILEGANFDTFKVFSHMEKCGYQLSYAEQQIGAGLCKEEEARYLEYAIGREVLVLKRTTFLDDGHPILYEKSIYRGDGYQYSIKLYRKIQENDR